MLTFDYPEESLGNKKLELQKYRTVAPQREALFDFNKISQSVEVAYPLLNPISMKYEFTDNERYKGNFYRISQLPSSHRLWNVVTDRETINLSNDPDTRHALHGGIISTNLTRFLVDLIYELKEDN